MKNLIYVLVFLPLFSYSYYPTIKDGNFWRVQEYSFFGNVVYERVNGDTLLNGKLYKQIEIKHDTLNWAYRYAAREDSTEQKIYFISPGQTREYLLYDYLLTAGDTARIYNPTQVAAGDSIGVVITVDSLDFVEIDNQCRKRLHIESPFVCNPEYWLLGVGSTYGLSNVHTCYISYGFELIDFIQFSDTVYSRLDTLVTCEPEPLTLKQVVHSNLLQLHPNPLIGTSSLQLKEAEGKGSELWIYDLNGELLSRKLGSTGVWYLNESDFRSGLYLFEIRDTKGTELGSGKFVVR